ncbi:hypothetical protein OCU04_001073 [Sclerotinia nivalis]|uniref:Uncharacterized protein n=1 Tax=Sclerotinia nivalis TaxID=352851 RepID=A0A9X0AXF9_9HELO|nr:hypothetical protein OCU04_001073 [Sclerotinia nivalis]
MTSPTNPPSPPPPSPSPSPNPSLSSPLKIFSIQIDEILKMNDIFLDSIRHRNTSPETPAESSSSAPPVPRNDTFINRPFFSYPTLDSYYALNQWRTIIKDFYQTFGQIIRDEAEAKQKASVISMYEKVAELQIEFKIVPEPNRQTEYSTKASLISLWEDIAKLRTAVEFSPGLDREKESSVKARKKIDEMIQDMEKMIVEITRLDKMGKKFEKIVKKIKEMGKKMDKMEKKVEETKENLKEMDEEIEEAIKEANKAFFNYRDSQWTDKTA